MGQDEPGEQKLISSYVISDLEVCGPEDTEHIDLPNCTSTPGPKRQRRFGRSQSFAANFSVRFGRSSRS
jgi:hypothetical protein